MDFSSVVEFIKQFETTKVMAYIEAMDLKTIMENPYFPCGGGRYRHNFLPDALAPAAGYRHGNHRLHLPARLYPLKGSLSGERHADRVPAGSGRRWLFYSFPGNLSPVHPQ